MLFRFAEKIKKLVNDEAALLSQMKYYLQIMSDIVVEDELNYALTMQHPSKHLCQGRVLRTR